MKKVIYVLLVLMFIPVLLSAQYNQDGRRIWPETVGSTQLTDGSIANADLATTAVDGGVMLEATDVVGWFACSFDSGTVDGLQGTNGWFLDASAPPAPSYHLNFSVFGFDADGGSTGDDIVYLNFVCPYDYEADGMEVYLYWFHADKDGADTDSVEWNASIHIMSDADTLVHTDSTLTVVMDMATSADSTLYIVNLNPELTGIDFGYGDLVQLKIWVDESDSQLDSSELAYLIGALITAERRDD